MFVIFPASFVYYISVKFRTEEGRLFCRRNALVPIVSFFASCVAAGFCAFFTFYRAFSGSSFFACFFQSWVPLVFFPAVMYGLFLLWSTDGMQQKIDSFIFFACPFYSVWLPYDILRTSTAPSFYTLFAKPVLFFCMVTAASFEIRRLYKGIIGRAKNDIVRSALILGAEILFPSLIESLWYYAVLYWLWVFLSFVYVVFTVYLNRRSVLSGEIDTIINKEVDAGKKAVKKLLTNGFVSKK